MDDHFQSLGVQLADLLENKKDIIISFNSLLSDIKADNVHRYEKMKDKLDDMERNIIYSLMDNMLKSMRNMNDTMQNMQSNIKSNIAQGLGNRGKVA